jgi:tRNA pseudouridine55 synthase
MTDTILLVDKPRGITSFDVIRILRRKLGIKKMGHAGTLDPLASGLMIIGINEGTKKLSEFLKLPKTYKAEILFGKKTDTGDLEGKVVEEADASALSEESVREAVKNFIGKHSLAVPAYSAVKRNGVPLYKLARQGVENIAPPIKEMEVTDARFLSFSKDGNRAVLAVELDVSSGTYIRTLGEELGRRLGVPATLQNLRRTKIGEFEIKDAIVLDEMK